MATLAELAQAYLNQKLPDISGIFSLPQATTPVTGPIVQEPITAPGLTPEQLRLLYSQQSGGGGERDNYIGGGIFGNLDLSRSKTITKDVYDEEEGDFVPTELTAYFNPQLGNYQTLEGKNINPAFSNTGATFGIGGGIMNMLGMTPKTVGGFVPGSIRGFYDSPIDIFKGNKNEQARTTLQKAKSLREDRERAEKLRAMREVASAPASTYRPGTTQRPGSGGGRDEGSSPSPSPSPKNSSQAGGSFNKLGFSDIRLKENVELIGKSPSNINIYKFNYKDNPMTYQGAMAHEVPWASVKHSNGYMMIDYNQIDVEFKKWQK
jgi:hypothetical protein